ncbi:hypothetical protein GH714_008692 [Hevea brasiliensis]|uniref:GH18 domain-containing protein n=1 Tax=Hevea brasiliensis TaxID=3981 RepID=A0A6A6MI85_HEVBR|nr:hypothetical protein GH714_008692 [Hevea brasiliensis]
MLCSLQLLEKLVFAPSPSPYSLRPLLVSYGPTPVALDWSSPSPAYYYSPTPSYSPPEPISPTSLAYPPMVDDENNAPGACPAYPPSDVSQGIKAAYWPSFNGLEPSSIDTSYFTHIYYAFLLLDPVSFKLNVTTIDQEKIRSS